MSSDLHLYSLSRNLAGVSGYGYRENVQNARDRNATLPFWAKPRIDIRADGPRIALPLSDTFIPAKPGTGPFLSIR